MFLAVMIFVDPILVVFLVCLSVGITCFFINLRRKRGLLLARTELEGREDKKT